MEGEREAAILPRAVSREDEQEMAKRGVRMGWTSADGEGGK